MTPIEIEVTIAGSILLILFSFFLVVMPAYDVWKNRKPQPAQPATGLVTMSKRRFTEARFCPLCGCETLDRDDYRREHGKKSPAGRSGFEFQSPEFLCRICGFGFRLSPSLRHEHATSLFRAHREMRPPVKNELGEKI